LKKIAIFASGSGSNARKIMEYFSRHEQIRAALVLSNKADAPVLEKARQLGVPALAFNRTSFYETGDVVQALLSAGIDWVVLAGFLWLVPRELIQAYPGRIVNIHPALLPKFGGKGMYGSFVHQAVVDAGERETGITIHLIDEHYDRGETVFQARCSVEAGDTPEDVSRKVQVLEHTHFAPVLERLILEREQGVGNSD
jgi:phosphoribosylglycinamide formyltransferase 1